jgi:hypothetical protein
MRIPAVVLLVVGIAFGWEDSGRAGPMDRPADVRLSVHVRDVAGRPVSGATVGVHALSSPEFGATRPVRFDDRWRLTTDAEGRLTTPALPGGDAYLLDVKAEGMLPEVSRWTRPMDAGEVRLPDVVLRRLLTIQGRIVDRNDRPVPGATVFQSGDGPERTEAVTDESGRFAVDGVPEGTAFLFAEKEGFRFHGERIDAAAGRPVTIVLECRDDSIPRTLRTLPPPQWNRTREERQELALGLVRPHFNRILEHGTDNDSRHWLVTAARIDPDLVLQNLGRIAFHSPNARALLLIDLDKELSGKSNGKELLWLVQLIDDPGWEVARYLRPLAERSASMTHGQKLQLIAEALVHIRAVDDFDSRWNSLNQVIGWLLQFDERDKALVLMAELEQLLNSLPPDSPITRGYRGNLAATYAHVDIPRALELLKDGHPNWSIRVIQNVAARDPVEAERILNTLTLDPDSEVARIVRRDLPEVCYRMARTDPDRAARVARQIFEAALQHRAENPSAESTKHDRPAEAQFRLASIYGLIAEATSRTDRQKAAAFLDQAVEILASLDRGHYVDRSGLFYITPAKTLSTLLPIAEQIDPALAHELFWRTLSLRLTESGEGERRWMHDISLVLMAQMLSRYDRDVARALIEPVRQREQSRSFSGAEPFVWVPLASIRIDPEGTLAWLETLPESPGREGSSSLRSVAERTVASSLISPETATEDEMRTFYENIRRSVRQALQITVELDAD